MSTTVTEKILTLAFHPGTSDNEAIAAFLQARKRVSTNPNFDGLINGGTSTSSSTKTESKNNKYGYDNDFGNFWNDYKKASKEPEPEVIYRDRVVYRDVEKVVFRDRPTPPQAQSNSWSATLRHAKLTTLIEILSGWRMTPYYTLKIVCSNSTTIDIELNVFLPSGDNENFESYFTRMWDTCIRNK